MWQCGEKCCHCLRIVYFCVYKKIANQVKLKTILFFSCVISSLQNFSKSSCESSILKTGVADPHPFRPDPDPDPAFQAEYRSGSRALMTKNCKKITAEKNFQFFFDQKLQFTYPQASIKNVQVTEEAFSSQKRPSNTSKHDFFKFFSTFVGHFALLDPDPDPQPCSKQKIYSLFS